MAIPARSLDGDSGFGESQDDESPARLRPAPRVRSGAEIQVSVQAISGLAGCRDARGEALGKGGYFAARWVADQSPVSPAQGLHRSTPNFVEVAYELEAAGRVAAGVQPFPGAPWCDQGRIAGRGVEEWLAWVFITGYPTPLWLDPAVSLVEVRALVLGEVGASEPGLLGPGVSRAAFPYDVADVIEAHGWH
jgi:hypothetical protein